MEKEYTVKLTDREIECLLSVIESQSVHAKIQAAQGKRSKEKTAAYTEKLCKLSNKLYQKLIEIHNA